MNRPDHILTFRGVSIRIAFGHYGPEIHATTRGYFPFSSTGFRSFSGVAAETATEQAFLEEQAALEDARREEHLRAVPKLLARPREDPLSNFLALTSAISDLLRDGFWATAPNRARAWRAAHWAFEALEDRRFQPTPRTPWTPEFCAKHLAEWRAARATVAAAMDAAPEILRSAPVLQLSLVGYFDLPAIAEARFAPMPFPASFVPVVDHGLPLPQPAPPQASPAPATQPAPVAPARPAKPAAVQLALF
jgi:hypothetical protein